VPYFPEIQAVQDKVITQVQYFFNHYKGKVIAITASKGKTTMSTLAYELLNNAGYHTKLVGNVGKPVLEEIDFATEYDFVIIELSSYMLQTLEKQNILSIVGAIFPEHLDWHGSLDKYLQAKFNILQGSEKNIIFSSTLHTPLFSQQCSTTPLSEDTVVACGRDTAYRWDTDFFYSGTKRVFPLSEVQLLGEHNLWNISAIVALAEVLHIDDEVLHETIKHFQPVRHRLQHI
jgi:UDP-N-acetylmuramoylalanine--D-glutamate ligase